MNKNNHKTIFLPTGEPSTRFNGKDLFTSNQVTLKRSSKGKLYWDIKIEGTDDLEVLERVKELDQAMIEYKEKVEV